jgi:hypothetical protein
VSEKSASKVEALDFIINVLREHEKRLDKLAHQLESAASSFAKAGAPPAEARTQVIAAERGWPSLQVARWSEFRARAQKPKTVAFQVVEGSLTISAWAGGMVFMYTERVPAGRVSLDCGYESQVSGSLDTNGLREWLAREFGMKAQKVVEGFLV